MVCEFIHGVNFDDIGYRPFVVRPELIGKTASTLKRMHSLTCDEQDETVKVFDSMLFHELKNLIYVQTTPNKSL
jgi:hypothetical protein